MLLAVQMKLTVEPTLTVRALGSSTVTSMGLDWMSDERKREKKVLITFVLSRLFVIEDIKKERKKKNPGRIGDISYILNSRN